LPFGIYIAEVEMEEEEGKGGDRWKEIERLLTFYCV